MTDRSLNTLSRRQALTATAAVVASVAATLPTSAAPGVSPELIRLRAEYDAARAHLEKNDDPLDDDPNFEARSIAYDAAFSVYAAARERFICFGVNNPADLDFKVNTIKEIYLIPSKNRESAWVHEADLDTDWLGRDIARLAGKGV